MGRYREGSDIDLALVTGPFNHSNLLRLSQKIDDLMLPYKVDLLAIHEIDSPPFWMTSTALELMFSRSRSNRVFQCGRLCSMTDSSQSSKIE